MTDPSRKAPPKPGVLANHLFTTMMKMTQRIRREIRRHGTMDLTIPQFRALLFVHRNPDSSLSAMAENNGMSLSSASMLVQRLVRDGHLERSHDPVERRRIRLRLSASGTRLITRAEEGTRAWLANEIVLQFTPEEQLHLDHALDMLAQIGTKERESL